MSRLEKTPIAIPAEVNVSFDGLRVEVEGQKGHLVKAFAGAISLRREDNLLWVSSCNDSRQTRAMVGTVHSIVRGMILGVAQGFATDLEISGVGFKAALQGKDSLSLSLGKSHPTVYAIPEGISVSVQDGTKLHVSGMDKQLVGQVAADIKAYYPVEPYKGKGVRIVGDIVRRKEGKKTA